MRKFMISEEDVRIAKRIVKKIISPGSVIFGLVEDDNWIGALVIDRKGQILQMSRARVRLLDMSRH